MTNHEHIPDGFILARTTDVFDNDTVPAGLLRAHRVADGVWGRLVVHDGSVRFVFEDSPDQPVTVEAGGAVVIPPARPHHVELDGPACFAVEFHRPQTTDPHQADGLENVVGERREIAGDGAMEIVDRLHRGGTAGGGHGI